MADMEKTQEEVEVEDTDTLDDGSNEDTDDLDVSEIDSEEDDTEDEEELTYDDYHKEKERADKAEKTIVKYKKQLKELKTKSNLPKDTSDTDVLTKTDYKIMSFIEQNPTYNGTEKQFKDYLAKGLSFEEAKKLVGPNKALTNREKLKSSRITGGEPGGTKATYTMDELENMSQKEYNKVMDLVDKGKASIE